MVHTLNIVEPIWPLLQNISKTLSLTLLAFTSSHILSLSLFILNFPTSQLSHSIHFSVCLVSLFSPLIYPVVINLSFFLHSANDSRVVLSTDNYESDYICASFVDVSISEFHIKMNIHTYKWIHSMHTIQDINKCIIYNISIYLYIYIYKL